VRADTQTQLKLIGVAGLIAATGWVSASSQAPTSLACQYQLPSSVVTPERILEASAADEVVARLDGPGVSQPAPYILVRLGPAPRPTPLPSQPLDVAPKQGPPRL
jgi:hypothetical protein